MKRNFCKSTFLATVTALALLSSCMGKRCVHTSSAELKHDRDLVVFKDVQVFTGDASTLLLHHDVCIEGGKITWLRPTGGTLPSGATVLAPGADHTLMPGIIDAHVHLTAGGGAPWAQVKADLRQNAATMLEAGVTTVYDLGGVSGKLEAAESKIAAGKWQGPRILHTHSPITTPGGHPIPAIQALAPKAAAKLISKLIPQVGRPEEAKAAVDMVMKQEVDFVKVICDSFAPGYPEMSDAVLQALVREAHAREQLVFVHAASAANARSAIAAGADILAHGPYRSKLSPAEAQAIGKSGVPMIYTLAATVGVSEMMQGKFQPQPIDHHYNGACLLDPVTGAEGKKFAEQPVLGGFGQWVLAHAPDQVENIRLLHAAGQRFLVGTDSPIPGAYAGSGVHLEMELLGEAGIPSDEVLRGATAWAADALGRGAEFGRVQEGLSADLILVKGNPIADLKATRALVYVVQQGRVYAVGAGPSAVH